MTQLEAAKRGRITVQMRKAARSEGVPPESIREKIAQGRIVIPYNKAHSPKMICAIGEGLTTKVNANLGTSSDYSSIKDELKKAKVSISVGAHTVMDLSTGGNISQARKTILRNCPV
ncbi:MAG: phosphomethylpyrimidine synthase ThiC, partial [Candidatus Omnitrophica bacterium]|nr:phosphomethylpyrimidine synthase ThiC [Candidatus Omnitrophota bacterium]